MPDSKVPRFIEEKQLVVGDVLADPTVEDNAFNRAKNGLWKVNQFKFKKAFDDEEEKLYVTLESVNRKNKAYITLAYNPLVIRPENGEGPSLTENFSKTMQVTRAILAPRPARFRGPGS